MERNFLLISFWSLVHHLLATGDVSLRFKRCSRKNKNIILLENEQNKTNQLFRRSKFDIIILLFQTGHDRVPILKRNCCRTMEPSPAYNRNRAINIFFRWLEDFAQERDFVPCAVLLPRICMIVNVPTTNGRESGKLCAEYLSAGYLKLCDNATPKNNTSIYIYATPFAYVCQSAKNAVLHIFADPCQAVLRQ
jgi:hypothetical protein